MWRCPPSSSNALAQGPWKSYWGGEHSRAPWGPVTRGRQCPGGMLGPRGSGEAPTPKEAESREKSG